jgi:hypothetical protein
MNTDKKGRRAEGRRAEGSHHRGTEITERHREKGLKKEAGVA